MRHFDNAGMGPRQIFHTFNIQVRNKMCDAMELWQLRARKGAKPISSKLGAMLMKEALPSLLGLIGCLALWYPYVNCMVLYQLESLVPRRRPGLMKMALKQKPIRKCGVCMCESSVNTVAPKHCIHSHIGTSEHWRIPNMNCYPKKHRGYENCSEQYFWYPDSPLQEGWYCSSDPWEFGIVLWIC